MTLAEISFRTFLEPIYLFVGVVAAIISVWWVVNKLRHRPRFLIGVIPFGIDSEYWMAKDPVDEASFSDDYFAMKYRRVCTIWVNISRFLQRCGAKFHISGSPPMNFDRSKYSHKELDSLKKDKHRLRRRMIEIPSPGKQCVTLPLLLKNIGGVNARKLCLAVNFDNQHIDILDVNTESFSVDILYSQHPEQVMSEKPRKPMIPSPATQAIYRRLDCPGAYVVLSGDLGIQAHEVLQLDLSIPTNIDAFNMIFGIDHENAISTNEYIQRIEVCKQQER